MGSQRQHTHVDKRSEHIDKRMPRATTRDVALYVDGSYKEGDGATYAAQPRRFGDDQDYGNQTEPEAVAAMARLPDRFGYEKSTVHTAELAAMLTSLRLRNSATLEYIRWGQKRAIQFNKIMHPR